MNKLICTECDPETVFRTLNNEEDLTYTALRLFQNHIRYKHADIFPDGWYVNVNNIYQPVPLNMLDKSVEVADSLFQNYGENKWVLFHSEDRSEKDNTVVPLAPEEPDMVNHPPHYANKEIECIEWIKAELGPEEFEGYLKGQVFKYMWRYPNKGNPVQDLEKAKWYLDRLIFERTLN